MTMDKNFCNLIYDEYTLRGAADSAFLRPEIHGIIFLVFTKLKEYNFTLATLDPVGQTSDAAPGMVVPPTTR